MEFGLVPGLRQGPLTIGGDDEVDRGGFANFLFRKSWKKKKTMLRAPLHMPKNLSMNTRRILNEYSTNTLRILNEEKIFSDEYLTKKLNLSFIFFCKTHFSVIFRLVDLLSQKKQLLLLKIKVKKIFADYMIP